MRYLSNLVVLSLTCCLVITTAFAADNTAKSGTPAIPTLGMILDASGIQISGFVDTAYTYCSTTGECAYRVEDTPRNSFNMQLVDLVVSKLPEEGFGTLVNLKVGPAADPNTQFGITQAYIQYALGPFTALAGKFTNLAGAEAIESPANYNFSRGYLFVASPNTHTGVRGVYAFSEQIKLALGVNNGWDNVTDDNKEKTLETSLTLTPRENLSVNLAYYSGKETVTAAAPPLPASTPATKTLADIVLTYSPTESLTIVLDYARGSQKEGTPTLGTAKWNGLAAYVNYKLNTQWRVAIRGESFDDKDGFVLESGQQKIKENTLTLAYMPSDQVELRTELRTDKSDKTVFLQSDGSFKKTQRSLALEAIYKF